MTFENSLIKNINLNDIHMEPFPYVIIKNPLKEEYYKELQSQFPSDDLFVKNKKYQENHRYNIFNYNYEEITKIWKQFLDYHSSEAFLNELINLFYKHLKEYYPNFIEDYENNKFKIGNSQKDFKEKKIDLCISADLAINTPLRKVVNTVRTPHLDNKKKIITGLFYMRNEEDKSLGGNLEICRFKNKFNKKYYGNSVPYKYVDVIDTVPYEQNIMIIFLNSPNSIHGVTDRSPTPFSRRFIYFSLSSQTFEAHNTTNNQISVFEEVILRFKRKLRHLIK